MTFWSTSSSVTCVETRIYREKATSDGFESSYHASNLGPCPYLFERNQPPGSILVTLETDASRHTGEHYRYRNVKPLATFAFAFLAAMGALGLTAAAHEALTKATEDEVISDPPDLRKVLVAVESRTGFRIQGRDYAVGIHEDMPSEKVASGRSQHDGAK